MMVPLLLVVIICILCPIFIPAVAVLLGSYLGLLMMTGSLVIACLLVRLIHSYSQEVKRPLSEQQKQNELDWGKN